LATRSSPLDNPSSANRHVDTPDFILKAARTLIGWSLQRYATTYSPSSGVQVELRFASRGGAFIPRSAFRSNVEWEVVEMRSIARANEATVWLTLRRRIE
jgi:hypothetical protein